jgi:PAS domain S-box-containing protein
MDEARDRDWFEREVIELREREQRYRGQVERQATLEQSLFVAWEALQQTLRIQPPTRTTLLPTLLGVARVSSRALKNKRTSVWLFDEPRERLVCRVLLIDGVEHPPECADLSTAQHAVYIRSLAEQGAVAVNDVARDARTQELIAYAQERDVVALLDIPIAIPGGLLGVVCHEHVGSARIWQREEINFASSVGIVVAVALESERRLLAEHAAQGSEAKYRHLVESLPVTVYSFDLRTRQLDYVSPQIFALGGWAADQWLRAGAEAWIERVHPEDRAQVLARFEDGAARGFPSEITYRVKLQTGETRWVRDTCALVRDHVGRAIAVQGTLADVTERTQAELERRELERRYRTLLENVDLIAVLLDIQGRITFVNDACVRSTGYSKEQALGADWFELMLPSEQRAPVRARFLDAVARGSVVPHFEITLRTANGSERRVLCMNTVLRDREGKVIGTSSLGLDLTDRLRLENELLQQTKFESLGRLAAGVAHDFNNLLTVMVAQAAVLDRQTGAASAGEARATLHSAIDQAKELTRSLLVYGRRHPLENEITPIDSLVRETLALAGAIAGTDLQLVTSLSAGQACVLADRSQIRQIILNLVGNAADATRGHGQRIEIRTHVEYIDDDEARKHGARRGGEFVVICVRDDGRGMDGKTMSHIFDPFFTTKGEERGTGLGLPLCQSVAERSGGYMIVESKLGSGTQFRVYLPRAKRDAQPPQQQPPAPPAQSGVVPSTQSTAARPKSILVVEDMPSIRQLLVLYLRESGYQVLEAADISSGARVLVSEEVDLLITDGALPDGAGQVLARSARIVRPHIRVLLVSGSSSGDENFDAILLKPFDQEQLLGAVVALIGEAQ